MSAFLAGKARRALVQERHSIVVKRNAASGRVVTESVAPTPAPTAAPATVPDNRAYLTALASMVPTEVIALHTAYVSYLRGKFEANEKKREADISAAKKGDIAALQQVNEPVGSLEARKLFEASDAFALQILFWGGIIVTIILYLWGRGKVTVRDLELALVPAAAYVVWMMLQPASAFDVVFSLAGAERGILSVLLAVVLLRVSTSLQKV